jgi:5-methylcytosine-specific restriction endonuclease McrA
MAVARVWVEWGPLGVIRIFKFRKEAIAVELAGGQVAEWPKGEAVKNLREQIFVRCNNSCELCGRWLDRTTGEMDEKHARGKLANDGTYGEYSLENSRFLCKPCHRKETTQQKLWFGARIDK